MSGVRARARERATASILAAARAQVAARGPAGLSMRAVARDVGMVSSAIYRYFPTREAVLGAVVVETHGHLDAALGNVPSPSPEEHWRGLAGALRSWARRDPREFELLYGLPTCGAAPPPEAIEAAAAVAARFRDAAGAGPAPWASVPPSVRAATVEAEVAALVGFLALELAGRLRTTGVSARGLYTMVVDRQVATLGLDLQAPDRSEDVPGLADAAG